MILLGPSARLADIAAIGRQTPTVVVARAATAEGIDVVRTDDVTGAELATRHLLELGHSRILHVDGGRAPGAAERRHGYQAAMRAAGLGRLASIIPGGLTEAEGSRAAGWLIDGRDADSATAAVVFNDQSAVGSWPPYGPRASTFHDNCPSWATTTADWRAQPGLGYHHRSGLGGDRPSCGGASNRANRRRAGRETGVDQAHPDRARHHRPADRRPSPSAALRATCSPTSV